MLTLYFSPGSCAQASLIALEEAGLAYEAKRVDFKGGEQQSAEYLAINPKGRVPVLSTDKGTITENPAILAYIAQTAPRARLAPLDDSFEFARMQSFNSYLCSTVHVNHAHGGRAYRWTDSPEAMEAMKAKVSQNMSENFALVEEKMLKGPWVMGLSFSVADCYLFTIFNWAEKDSVDISRLPKLVDHRTRMLQRPAVQRALAVEKG
jgi:glutathione S-transferase